MTSIKRFALRFSLIVLGYAFVAPAARAEPVSIEKFWEVRAGLAKQRLAKGSLDECDIAFEKAFLQPKVKRKGSSVDYGLRIEISGQVLVVTYSFEEGKVTAFHLVALPRYWMARQLAANKTLSILVAPKMCAMDFCTNNPFSDGPCSGETVGP